jgi:hypothetical protein
MSCFVGMGQRQKKLASEASFRDPAAARAAGVALIPAGLLVAVALTLHPLPAGGFEESPSQLSGTPLWAAVHAAIAAGFVLGTVGGVLVLVSGGPLDHWTSRLAWAALTIGSCGLPASRLSTAG